MTYPSPSSARGGPRPSGDPLVGALFERRYRVDAPIARGGMSTVYVGCDLRLDRPIAIKVMDPRYAADPTFVARFEFEARAVARLKSPGLVAVYDQGIDDEVIGSHGGSLGGFAFIVMELVSGGTLRELLAERGPMPPHAATAVALPVLDALGTAHVAGLVHRDIKPENVLISTDGEIKVADFGLVRAVAAANVTSNSVILGTAAYLSPEQVEFGDADARSDVYATGLLLFEMLTGTTPFSADSPIALAYQRLHHDVPPPSTVIAGVPPEFDSLVLKATARDPGRRFVDGHDMADALSAVASRLALPAFTVPPPSSSAETAAEVVAARLASQQVPAGSPAPSRSPLEQTDLDQTDAEQPEFDQPHFDHAAPGGRQGGPRPTRAHTVAGRFEDLPPAADDRETVPAASGRRRSRGLIIGAVIAVVTIIMAVAGWWLGSGQFTVVPDITGMDRPSAERTLEAAGLDVEAAGFYDNDIAADTVTEVSPGPGERVSRFGSVRLDFSRGRPVVPDLTVGSPLDSVRQQLEHTALNPVEGKSEYSDSVPTGGVLRLTPGPGSTLPVGADVSLIVSAGQAPVTIPDVSGMSPDDARTALKALGLKVSQTQPTFSRDVVGGNAVGTAPARGTQAQSGSSVTLLISNAITVPDVSGLSTDDARKALTKAGFTVTEGAPVSSGEFAAGTVVESNPAAGGNVDPHRATVAITVSNSVKVPSVLGSTVGSGRKELERAGFTVKVSGLIGADGSLVIAQDVDGGKLLAPGATITITALP